MMRTSLTLCLLLAACGSETGGANSLSGSAERSYNLDFDYLAILHQQDHGQTTYTVRYVREQDDGAGLRWPVILVVRNPEQGVSADLTAPGNRLYRQDDGSDFVLASGSVTFTTLGGPGELASGSFAAVLDVGSTLIGNFSAIVQGL